MHVTVAMEYVCGAFGNATNVARKPICSLRQKASSRTGKVLLINIYKSALVGRAGFAHTPESSEEDDVILLDLYRIEGIHARSIRNLCLLSHSLRRVVVA